MDVSWITNAFFHACRNQFFISVSCPAVDNNTGFELWGRFNSNCYYYFSMFSFSKMAATSTCWSQFGDGAEPALISSEEENEFLKSKLELATLPFSGKPFDGLWLRINDEEGNDLQIGRKQYYLFFTRLYKTYKIFHNTLTVYYKKVLIHFTKFGGVCD